MIAGCCDIADLLYFDSDCNNSVFLRGVTTRMLNPSISNGSQLSTLVEERTASKPLISFSLISNSGLLCEALVILLQTYQNVHLLGNYSSSGYVTENLPNPAEHVLLIDSGIGSERTITCIQHWRRLMPSPYIIVLELEDDIDSILACIEAGAQGYTLQGASSVEVNQVILQARQGIAQCSPTVTAKLFSRLANLRAQSQKIDSPLTQRETEVLRLIAKGYSDRAIALELVIELCTVKHHVHNLLHKLAVKHRWDAARIAIAQGWIDRG